MGSSHVTLESVKNERNGTSIEAAERVLEFCRLANVSIGQNTKNRSETGFKDDSGNYHVMYRYGIVQILKLFCPPEVEKLRCCGRVWSIVALRQHVLKTHERMVKCEPSLEPV